MKPAMMFIKKILWKINALINAFITCIKVVSFLTLQCLSVSVYISINKSHCQKCLPFNKFITFWNIFLVFFYINHEYFMGLKSCAKFWWNCTLTTFFYKYILNCYFALLAGLHCLCFLFVYYIYFNLICIVSATTSAH